MKKHLLFFILVISFQYYCVCGLQAQGKSTSSILMVLDVQEHYVDNMMKQNDANEFIRNLNEIIRISRPMDIVFIKAKTDMKVLTISLKGIKAEPIENMDLEPRLYRKKNDRVFTKEASNAFALGDFRAYLDENHIGTVYMVGLFAEECVSATAIDGERGYEMILIREGIAAKRPRKREKILQGLEEEGVEIIGLGEFMGK